MSPAFRSPGNGTPAGIEPALALSVDVEDYSQVQAFDESGARGTFFILGWVARTEPGLVREIAARGHEVASHGMDHRMLTELSPAEFLQQARDSRALLEDHAQAAAPEFAEHQVAFFEDVSDARLCAGGFGREARGLAGGL